MKNYNIYTDDANKNYVETIIMSDEEARYQSTNGYICEEDTLK